MKREWGRRSFLCVGLLLLGGGTLMLAQDSAGQSAPASDNRINERDRNPNQPTADQPPNNRSDRDLTQQVRQAIIADKTFSTYAHNVKVISQQGQVTLKGPVRSGDEKRAVEAKAAAIAGVGKVNGGDCQTEKLNVHSKLHL